MMLSSRRGKLLKRDWSPSIRNRERKGGASRRLSYSSSKDTQDGKCNASSETKQVHEICFHRFIKFYVASMWLSIVARDRSSPPEH